jgi:alkanesulfonate monooxygenase SsuD/methylene tetrahydromethanopterin reductase-like flavin-dependent oxidoreductase (luciferase family)
VELGVFLLAGQFPGRSQADALGGAVDYALAAERAGLASAWVAEHHFISYGVCPSAVALAANLLGRSSRLAVGTAVCMLANRHPVALAEETALLDHLGGGRFHLGVGRGGPWVDLEVFGTGLDRYEHGFADSLDLLLRWLEGDRVGADGPRFRFREVAVVPRPATRPRPPVVVAATSPATVATAAARGLPLLLGLHAGDDDKAALLRHYRQVAERHGHDPDAVGHLAAAVAQVADTTAEALACLRAAMPPWLERGVGQYVSIAAGPRPRRDPRAYVEHLLRIHPVGTPERCAERLAASAERTGVRRFLLMVEGSGDRDRSLENVARLGAEVARALASPPAGQP